MDKNLLWDVFMETGDIEVYLKYKEEEGKENSVEAYRNDGTCDPRGEVRGQ